eukprot:TRINITY_DN34370_c0_g1_i1.p2 TRINITY_DN34370_c0_g1~~TRINITY_DN34370_c0_g1_i1.p2  ORF type:complete len:126 (+),score=26.07 TRINITY_DN34370_c0_g1_i1:67-444(+)
MFLQATAAVLQSDELMGKFQIPEALWPRIRSSWRHNQATVAGRLDLSVTPEGIKAFEYNIDTASCLFEAGSTQGRWAESVGLPGRDAGSEAFRGLVGGGEATGVSGTLHLRHDDDEEERYPGLYM